MMKNSKDPKVQAEFEKKRLFLKELRDRKRAESGKPTRKSASDRKKGQNGDITEKQ